MSVEPADEGAASLYRRDACSQALGIEIVAASGQSAVVRMLVRPDMCNGFGIVHGGMTFLLADTAMAFASNAALDGNPGSVALAASAEIDWLAPVRAGDTITATADRRWTNGRTAVWDIVVTNTAGDTVALCRGRTRAIARPADLPGNVAVSDG